MLKKKRVAPKVWVAGLTVSFLITCGLTLMASPVFAKTINLKFIGTVPLIAIIIGIIIVLLQLIPAAILFFSFIGTISTMIFKGRKATEEVVEGEEETVPFSGYGPIPVKNE